MQQPLSRSQEQVLNYHGTLCVRHVVNNSAAFHKEATAEATVNGILLRRVSDCKYSVDSSVNSSSSDDSDEDGVVHFLKPLRKLCGSAPST